MENSKEKMNKLFDGYQEKRLEIGDCLFSTSRYSYRVSNAKKLVKLSSELVELATLIENS